MLKNVLSMVLIKLAPTNAEVQLVDKQDFVYLDRLVLGLQN